MPLNIKYERRIAPVISVFEAPIFYETINIQKAERLLS
jgi:hypothetical protein